MKGNPTHFTQEGTDKNLTLTAPLHEARQLHHLPRRCGGRHHPCCPVRLVSNSASDKAPAFLGGSEDKFIVKLQAGAIEGSVK